MVFIALEVTFVDYKQQFFFVSLLLYIEVPIDYTFEND